MSSYQGIAREIASTEHTASNGAFLGEGMHVYENRIWNGIEKKYIEPAYMGDRKRGVSKLASYARYYVLPQEMRDDPWTTNK